MYIMEKKVIGNGQLTYRAITNKGTAEAVITIRDGRYQNYSMVPCIRMIAGEEKGILFLLNWMISKTKSPLISTIKSQILKDYGFVPYEGGLVWKDGPRIKLVRGINRGNIRRII